MSGDGEAGALAAREASATLSRAVKRCEPAVPEAERHAVRGALTGAPVPGWAALLMMFAGGVWLYNRSAEGIAEASERQA